MSKERTQGGRPRVGFPGSEKLTRLGELVFDTVLKIEKGTDRKKCMAEFLEQAKVPFVVAAERIAGVLESRERSALATARATRAREKAGDTAPHSFVLDGMRGNVGPAMTAVMVADKDERRECEGILAEMALPPPLVMVDGDCQLVNKALGIREPTLHVWADEIPHLYRVPLSIHLDCPRAERIAGVDLMVDYWKKVRETYGFQGVRFREKPAKIHEAKRKPDRARLIECIAACKNTIKDAREDSAVVHHPDYEPAVAQLRAQPNQSASDIEWLGDIVNEALEEAGLCTECKGAFLSELRRVLIDRQAGQSRQEGRDRSTKNQKEEGEM